MTGTNMAGNGETDTVPSPTKEQSKSIQAINKDAVHRICSGQVVLNLATAVKELVENSLDAGATSLEIRLKEYGSELVEVIDNGCGVEEQNMQGLTLKHHTSKLREFSDLVGVETFGFRGEALSSLCALSEMTVITRHKSCNSGTKLSYDSRGHIASKVPCARQVGTTVTLGNLFSPLPVRQKEFLRNLKREFNKMTQLLYAYCLISRGVRILCTNQTKKGNKSVVVSTQGSSTYKGNITCIFGAKQGASLLDVDQQEPLDKHLEEFGLGSTALTSTAFQLEGCISSCAHGQGRSASDRQFYFINDRPCDPTKVSKIVNDVYHQFNLHQYPFVFLNIKTARCGVDVNVTPDKRQIFLDNEKLLLATVKASLLKLYETVPSTFQFQNVPTASALEKDSTASSSHSALGSLNQSPKFTTEQMASPQNKLSSLLKNFSHSPVSSQKQRDTDSLYKQPSNITSGRGVKRSIESASYDTDGRKQLCLTSFIKNKPTKTAESDDGKSACAIEIINKEENEDVIYLDGETSTVIELECDVELEAQNTTERRGNVDIPVVIEEIERRVSEEVVVEDIVSSASFNSHRISRGSGEKESDTCDIGIESETLKEACRNTSVPSVMFDAPSTCALSGRKVVQLQCNIDSIRQKFKRPDDKKCQDLDHSKPRVRFYAEIDPSKNKNAEQELRKEISKDMFSKMKIIGQFNLGFIITQFGPDLFIVDQHATDEKYNFEMLQLHTTIHSQRLVVPQTLELTAANECILMENIDIFLKNGFEFVIDEEAEPTKRIRLAAKPTSRNWEFGKEDIDELLFMLQDTPHCMCRPSRVRAMFASRACRKSVMIGTALNNSTMRQLVNHMGELEQPWNCPHGRPTMRHLVNLELVRKCK